MDIKKTIQEIENKWLKLLFENCKQIFEKCKLPSHDHFHHLRVWNYTKELIIQINTKQKTISEFEIESLIIACFFHDTGMIIDKGIEHGKISSKICYDFLKRNMIKAKNIEQALEAIEKHDNKEYNSSITSDNIVLSILCISDDLDAFGAIGTYRYTEIYLLRDISIDDLPGKVIKNLQYRYDNFISTFEEYAKIISYHKKRYLYTRRFFEELEKELNQIPFNKDCHHGKTGIINLMNQFSIIGEIPIEDIYDKITTKNYNKKIINFFKQIKDEYILLNSLI